MFSTKKIYLCFLFFNFYITAIILPVFADDSAFNFYETPTPYLIKEHSYERYRPRTITPLISVLPEYSLFGPGYICEKRQPPPVYRFPIQYNRHMGYREGDWAKNDLIDKHMFPLEFGGYTY